MVNFAKVRAKAKSRAKAKATRRKVSIPSRGNRNNTKKSLSKSPNEQQQQQQQTPEDVDAQFEEYIRKRKQKADIGNYLKLRKIKSKTRSKTRSKTSTSSKTRSKTRSKTSVLQTHRDFEALGIKKGDWMTDPCSVLNNIKSKLKVKKWTDDILSNLDFMIPELQRIPQSKTSSKKSYSYPIYKYGDKTIQIKEEIGSGAYGTVHKGVLSTSNTVNSRPIVIKHIKSTATLLEIFTETILQMELFCGLRGQFGTGARIPKMEFISKYTSGSDTNYVIGMEPLDGDFFSFFTDSNVTARSKIKAIQDIAKLLKRLQNKYKFMHRDLHGANIMYKKQGTPGKETYKMFIIDFGLSTAVIKKQQINEINDFYDRKYTFNPSQDLRTLITSLLPWQNRFDKTNMPNPYLLMTLLICATSLLRYIEINFPPIFHGTYTETIAIEDLTFVPSKIIKIADYLLSLPPRTLETTSRDPAVYNKAFDELLPVIGNRVLKELQQYKKKQNKWIPLTNKKGKQIIPDKGVQHTDVRFRDFKYKDEIERSMLFKYINGMLEFYLNKRYESYIGKLQSAFIRQR
jgi:serine/threonine protein kinase